MRNRYYDIAKQIVSNHNKMRKSHNFDVVKSVDINNSMTDTKYSDLIKQGCKNIIREKKDYLVKTRRMRETLSNMV